MADFTINSIKFTNVNGPDTDYALPSDTVLVGTSKVTKAPVLVRPNEIINSIVTPGDRINIKTLNGKLILSADVNSSDLSYLERIQTCLKNVTASCDSACTAGCTALSASSTCDGCTGSCYSTNTTEAIGGVDDNIKT